jgi:hypothetical protein
VNRKYFRVKVKDEEVSIESVVDFVLKKTLDVDEN